MRIDKYLWCVRLFKTRTLASEQVKNNKVLVGEEVVKPSREVKPGEKITLKKHGYNQILMVVDFPKSRVGAKLVQDYVEDITPTSEKEKEEFLRLAKSLSRPKGQGRPTKKDRRNLDELGL